MSTTTIPLTIGSHVIWNKSADSTKRGTVYSIYRERIVRTIDNTKVELDTGDHNPAYLIEQDNGESVLKLHSEVSTID